MTNKAEEYFKRAYNYLKFWVIGGLILLVAGICCLATMDGESEICNAIARREYNEIHKLDYSDCLDYTSNDNAKCSDTYDSDAKKSYSCKCAESIELKNDYEGEIIMLYKLDSFNKSSLSNDKYYQSRDDEQLRGVLKDPPAKACDPFRFDDANRSIAPCGAIADAMFNDSFEMSRDSPRSILPSIPYGMLLKSDKDKFRNPEPRDNLSVAFQNFTKPKSWRKNVWELDTANPENNGFENEPFIAWMRTDMDSKPVWRLDRTGDFKKGLEKGNYTLVITYNYPPAAHSGPRWAILALANDTTTCDYVVTAGRSSAALGFGVFFVIVSVLLLLLAGTAYVYVTRKTDAKNEHTEQEIRPIK